MDTYALTDVSLILKMMQRHFYACKQTTITNLTAMIIELIGRNNMKKLNKAIQELIELIEVMAENGCTYAEILKHIKRL